MNGVPFIYKVERWIADELFTKLYSYEDLHKEFDKYENAGNLIEEITLDHVFGEDSTIANKRFQMITQWKISGIYNNATTKKLTKPVTMEEIIDIMNRG